MAIELTLLAPVAPPEKRAHCTLCSAIRDAIPAIDAAQDRRPNLARAQTRRSMVQALDHHLRCLPYRGPNVAAMVEGDKEFAVFIRGYVRRLDEEIGS